MENRKMGDNIPEPVSAMVVGLKQKDQPEDIKVEPEGTLKLQFGPTFSIKTTYELD